MRLDDLNVSCIKTVNDAEKKNYRRDEQRLKANMLKNRLVILFTIDALQANLYYISYIHLITSL